MILNVYYPAPVFVPDGIPTEVSLYCVQDGIRHDKEFEKVTIRVTTTPSYSIEEISALEEGDEWGVNVFYATKITNPCDASIIYVKDYINDIEPFVHCCIPNIGSDEAFWIDWDDEDVYDFDDSQINYI